MIIDHSIRINKVFVIPRGLCQYLKIYFDENDLHNSHSAHVE
jgi:hypothetical protein